MRVLAIDPGYDRLGLAVLEGDPSRPTYVWSDCVTPARGAREARLAAVHEAIVRAIAAYTPDVLALETLFFSTNVKTALAVAEARGVVRAVAGAAGVPLTEHSPQAVKLAVTGNGRADKAAVARMVPRVVVLPEKRRLDDENDALALALAALAAGRASAAPVGARTKSIRTG